jgi:probable HAF family extracellular repeat protein
MARGARTSWTQAAGCSAAAFAALAVTNFAHAQCVRYHVDQLFGPDCQFDLNISNASSISPTGEICGSYSTCDGGGRGAVWLGQDQWIPLPLPPGVSGIAPRDINSSRQIAAYIPDTIPTLRRAALYDFNTSTLINLGVLPGGNTSESTAINEDGVVCGYSHNTVTGPLQAFRWVNGTNVRIASFPGTDIRG